MSEPRLKPLIALVLLVGLVLFLGREATTWASPLAKPGRQTVPLTPPATWTPNVQVAPTAAQPTRPPSADRSGTVGPYPILTVQADPTVLSPGQVSVISVALTNSGNGPLSEAVVTLTQPGLLRLTRSRAAGGSGTWPLSAHLATGESSPGRDGDPGAEYAPQRGGPARWPVAGEWDSRLAGRRASGGRHGAYIALGVASSHGSLKAIDLDDAECALSDLAS
jgi:hypothetical protein